MVCKELILELRTNKRKYTIYASLGVILLFLLSSVIYLLVIVSHLNSIIDVNSLGRNNIDKVHSLTDELTPTFSGLVTGDTIKPTVSKQQDIRADFYYNLTQTETMLINHINHIKKEFSENITKIKDEQTKTKRGVNLNISKMLFELKLFINTTKVNLDNLEINVYKNFTKVQHLMHLNRKQDKKELVSLINKISNFTIKNISYLKERISDTKTTLKHIPRSSATIPP